VFDIASLGQIAAITAVIVAPVVLVRILAGGGSVGLEGLFPPPGEPPWPRGVQEEEPRQWRIDLVARRADSAPAVRAAGARAQPRLRPAATRALDRGLDHGSCA
jgi:hypothetical protein